MTIEEIIRNLEYTMKKHKDDTVNTFGTNISAMCKDILDYLEQQPCDDCISRQAVHDLIAELLSDYLHDEDREKIEELDVKIEDLPPVTPKEKTGHWEYVQYDYNPNIGNWHCSECRNIVVMCVNKKEMGGIPLYKYCPNCGAKMIEPQESEVKNEVD